VNQPRSLFRRDLLDGPTVPDPLHKPVSVSSPVPISPRWEGGVVELRSPDAFARWQITQALDQHEQTYLVATGPSSAHSLFLEQGAQISAQYFGAPDLGWNFARMLDRYSVRPSGTPYWKWTTIGQAPTITKLADPHLLGRVYPSICSPRDLRAGFDQAALFSQINNNQTEAAALNSPNWQTLQAVATGGEITPIGYVPGHANRVSVWCAAPCTLHNGGPGVGTYGVGGTATYHELAVSPWDFLGLSTAEEGPVSYRVSFWRQGT